MVESKKTNRRVISNEFKPVSLDVKKDENQEKMRQKSETSPKARHNWMHMKGTIQLKTVMTPITWLCKGIYIQYICT
jgi:hypothetical protein